MSSKNKNKAKRLQEQIKKCQDETKKLLQEKVKDGWSDIAQILEQEKESAEAEPTRQKLCKPIATSKSEKELEDLKEKIKCVEEYESELKVKLERRQVHFAEYKKLKESELRKIERRVDEIEKIMSDESGVNELCKRRKELEKRLRNLDDFCVAVYSTFES